MSILIPRRGNWPTLPQMAAPVRTEFAGDTWAPWSSGLYTDSANITIKTNALGLAWDNADTAGYITLPAKTYQVSDGFTLVFVCEVRNQNFTHAMPFGDAAGHADFLWHESGSFRLRCNAVDFQWAAQSGALAAYAIVVTPAGQASLYRDGKFVGTVSGSGTSFKLASIGRGFFTYPAFDGQVNLVHVIPRAISLDVAQKLSENAANLFAPLRQDRYFPAGASALAAEADGAAVASGSASLAAAVGLAGVGVAVAGGSAALGAAVPLSAAGIAVASGTAGLVATVTIDAAGLAQAAGTAGLSAAVLLAAAGAAEAAGNATLAAQLAAIASGSAQASGTATLSGGAEGSISAAGTAVASGSAALVVSVALAASGAAQAGGTATLSGGPAGAISASGAAEASGSAAMVASVVLTAAGFVAAAAAGSLTVAVELTATGLAIATGAAVLTTGAQTAERLRKSVYCRLATQAPFVRLPAPDVYVRH